MAIYKLHNYCTIIYLQRYSWIEYWCQLQKCKYWKLYFEVAKTLFLKKWKWYSNIGGQWKLPFTLWSVAPSLLHWSLLQTYLYWWLVESCSPKLVRSEKPLILEVCRKPLSCTHHQRKAPYIGGQLNPLPHTYISHQWNTSSLKRPYDWS